MSRPLAYKFANGAKIGGHYKVAQLSGAIAATPTALDHWARIRWVPTDAAFKLVLLRLQCGLSVSGAITTLIQFTLDAIKATSYTVDHSAAITNISMVNGANKMSNSCSTSLLGATGPGICTTAPMTGQTAALDAEAFAVQDYPMITAVTATGTAILGAVGVMSGIKDLYRWDGPADHPPELTTGQGIIVRIRLTGHATGTLTLRTIWEFAEVIDPFGND